MKFLPLAFVVLAAGCGGTRATGPAWPKLSEPEADGGHSIAPEQPSVASAIESKPDRATDAEPAAKPEPATAASAAEDADASDEPAASSTESEDGDEIIITTEEIVIEIDEDDE